MADEAAETLAGALRNWLGALGFILPLVGVEEVSRHFVDELHPSLPVWVSLGLILAGLLIYALPAAVKWAWGLSEGRRQQLLTWVLILGGAALLVIGAYRLGLGNSGYTQQQVDEKIAAAVAADRTSRRIPKKPLIPPGQAVVTGSQAAKEIESLRSQVDDLRRQRDEAQRQKQAPTPNVTGSPMGPKTTMSIIAQLTAIGGALGIQTPTPRNAKWALIFFPSEEATKALILSFLATAGLDVMPIPAADRNLQPEAPDLSPSGDPGITLRGNSALSRRLFEVLPQCLIVHHREKEPDNLQEWYGRSAQGRQIVWIEIGAGPIWTMDQRCWI